MLAMQRKMKGLLAPQMENLYVNLISASTTRKQKRNRQTTSQYEDVKGQIIKDHTI